MALNLLEHDDVSGGKHLRTRESLGQGARRLAMHVECDDSQGCSRITGAGAPVGMLESDARGLGAIETGTARLDQQAERDDADEATSSSMHR